MKYFFLPLHVVLRILEMCLSSSRTKNFSFIFISRIYHLYFRTKKNKRWGKILFSVVHNIIVNQTKRISYKLYFSHILMIYEHITKNKRTLYTYFKPLLCGIQLTVGPNCYNLCIVFWYGEFEIQTNNIESLTCNIQISNEFGNLLIV